MQRMLCCLAVLIGLVLAVVPGYAGDVLNYQGMLTDLSGNQVPDATYSISFKIFDALTEGSELWSDVFPAVQTSKGLFGVLLGSQADLDLGALGSGSLYLEIQVGSSTALTPRTLLTSSPRAASAGRIIGSVETGDNSLLVKREDGESGILVNSPGSKVSIYMFAPQPEPPKEVLEISSMSSSGAVIKMFAPQPEPPRVLLQMNGDAVQGPSMDFFDEAGQVMGIEPSPFNSGFSINLFAPQRESPQQLVEIRGDYGSGNSSALTMSGLLPGGPTIPLASMTAREGIGTLRIGQSTDSANSGPLIEAMSNGTESSLVLKGPTIVGTPASIISAFTNAGARLGIGAGAPTHALEVIGDICYTGSIGACSDIKYKRNVRELDGALDAVMTMRGVRYEWRTDDYPEMRFGTCPQVGFVAQEVKEVLPEAVIEQSDGSLSVDYSRITPLLLEAIKELRLLVDRQQVEINELRSKLEEKSR
ncbi:MAG: tail fiber domain-containing protein [Candidatus Zixiibacteriota bacterium]